MERRARVILGATPCAALAVVAACSNILGYQDIPQNPPPPDASTRHDAGADGGKPDAGHDAGKCGEAGATRCEGLGVETCSEDGGWGPVVACGGMTPVCLGSQCSCVPGSVGCFGESPLATGQLPWMCALQDDGTTKFVKADEPPCAGTCALGGCQETPPSCQAAPSPTPLTYGVNDCPDGSESMDNVESCCTSNEVPGGSFFMSYDGFSDFDGESYTQAQYPASVSSFRLDRFEVTVGRFRPFVEAVTKGSKWVPPPGSGKHTHLNGGQGVQNRGAMGTTVYETGWDAAWDPLVALNLGSDDQGCVSTFTGTPGPQDLDPINCLSWAQAYAFCIWDGGFLPTEAEWNYAAAGGSDQRVYPWSPPIEAQPDASPDLDASCSNANYLLPTMPCSSIDSPGPQDVGRESKPGGGDSKWSHADMAGNLIEWTLDVSAPEPMSLCPDCAFLAGDGGVGLRVERGGAFLSPAPQILTSYRAAAVTPSSVNGVRCARVP